MDAAHRQRINIGRAATCNFRDARLTTHASGRNWKNSCFFLLLSPSFSLPLSLRPCYSPIVYLLFSGVLRERNAASPALRKNIKSCACTTDNRSTLHIFFPTSETDISIGETRRTSRKSVESGKNRKNAQSVALIETPAHPLSAPTGRLAVAVGSNECVTKSPRLL